MKFPVLIHLRDDAVIRKAVGIARIENRGGVGIRYVDRADGREISHEGQEVAIGRKVQRDFRLRRETGDHLILGRRDSILGAVGHFERIQERARGSHLVEKNLRGDSEAGVDKVVVKNERIGAVGYRGYTAAGCRRSSSAARPCRPERCSIVIVDAAANHQVTGEEEGTVALCSFFQHAGQRGD